jgi:acetolactate synthase-1/2/3 large subunit
MSSRIKQEPKAKITGAKLLAHTLKGYGTTHIFYIETLVTQGLSEMAKLGIKRILAHSEKSAAYMADGYARVSRKPGICMCQSVGAANLAAGLQDAYLNSSPVIAFTGRKPPLYQYRNAYQEIDHNIMFDPVTKYNARVDTLEQYPILLRQAFREATSVSPGPVHLDLLGFEGEITDTSEAELELLVETQYREYPALRTSPAEEDLKAAIRLLCEAKSPVIVAGGGARMSQAGPEIIELAEKLSIPVATSLDAKGIIPDNHPLSIGPVGTYCRWCANKVVSMADLVLFIGSKTGDQVTNHWRLPPLGTKIIQVDINPSELGRNYPNDVSLLGDAKATCAGLVELSKTGDRSSQWAEQATEIVKQWRTEAEARIRSDSQPIYQERLCKEISDVLPENGIVVADTGFASVWTGAYVDIIHPTQSFMRAAGSLGWAFPASLGAKCAAPEKPVICFIGDGGFMYHLTELETAARWGINTVTVVNNNHSLGMCIEAATDAHEGDSKTAEDLYLFKEINFANIAKEMGCVGVRVHKPDEIRPAIEEALGEEKPVVIDVVTDKDNMAPWPPPEFTVRNSY